MKLIFKTSFLILAFSFHFIKMGVCQENTADCIGALVLCEKKEIFVKNLYGVGKEPYETGFTSCSKNLVEKNTIWIKWIVDSPGDIGFTITPLQPTDDIDFIVYKIGDDIWNCSARREIRCMAAGDNIGAMDTTNSLCLGKTGLRIDDNDFIEKDGCDNFQDNFLSSFYAQKGEAFMLYINNYSSEKGFKLFWSGDATFSNFIRLPLTEQTQYSNLVYFKHGDINKKHEWNDAILDRAVIASTNYQAVSINTFVGCSNNIELFQGETKIHFDIGILFPNPVATYLFVPLDIPVYTTIKVDIYNTLGNLSGCHEMITDKGEQVVQVPVSNLPTGLYFIKFRIGAFQVTRKIIVHR